MTQATETMQTEPQSASSADTTQAPTPQQEQPQAPQQPPAETPKTIILPTPRKDAYLAGYTAAVNDLAPTIEWLMDSNKQLVESAKEAIAIGRQCVAHLEKARTEAGETAGAKVQEPSPTETKAQENT